MNIKDIHLLYEYNYWANKRILGASVNLTQEQFLASGSFPYGGLRGTLVHTLDSEWSWRHLIESIGSASEPKDFDWANWPELKEADFPTIDSLETRWREEEQAMRAYLGNLSDADMERHLRYTTDTGIKRDRILWHCLLHVVNHGTQHRSEAAALLTEYGHSPGDLDFTVFLNEYASPPMDEKESQHEGH